jgi:hypothetical protein
MLPFKLKYQHRKLRAPITTLGNQQGHSIACVLISDSEQMVRTMLLWCSRSEGGKQSLYPISPGGMLSGVDL